MKRILLALLLMGCAVPAWAVDPAPSGVQVTGTSDCCTAYPNFTTSTFTATAGRYAILEETHCTQFACSGSYYLSYTDTVTSTLGNTVQPCGYTYNNDDTTVSIWLVELVNGGTESFVLNSKFGSNVFNFEYFITEMTGLAAAQSCTNFNNAMRPGATTAPSLATSGSVACGDLVFGYAHSTVSTPTSPTLQLNTAGGSDERTGYKIATASGAATLVWASGSYDPLIVVASVPGNGCASGGPPPQRMMTGVGK